MVPQPGRKYRRKFSSSSRLLLGHAVQRTQAQHQIATGDADYGAVWKQPLKCTYRDCVVLIDKRRDQEELVGNIEICVTRGQALAAEKYRRRHGERDDAQILAVSQTRQIFSKRLIIELAFIRLDYRDDSLL